MTFDNAPSAIDGALLSSAIVRRGNFAFGSGGEGVVLKDDLKVTELAVPGVGLLIEAGVGLVLNRYQSTPNESYVVSNPGAHTITSGEMPGSNPSATSWIVAVVVGDPDFSQIGHPWMLATDPPIGQEQSFNYIRPTLIQVANDTVTELDVDYPALVQARIDIPASTTTITDSMITDLRHLARPRQTQEAFASPGGTWSNASPRYIPHGSTFADWGAQEFKPQVRVPDWATRAILIVNVNGVRFNDQSVNIAGKIRAQLGSVSGPQTNFDYEATAGGGTQRSDLMCAGEYDVASVAGTNVFLRVEGYQNAPGSPTNNQTLRLQYGSQMVFDVRFFEE